jgi:hypothetical protein
MPYGFGELLHGSWHWDAFGAFGAMSGFSLTALSVAIALRGNPDAESTLDSPPGRLMLRWVVHSMWLWLAPASLALACGLFGGRLFEAAFLGSIVVALFAGLRAVFAFTLFYEPWTRARPQRVFADDEASD